MTRFASIPFGVVTAGKWFAVCLGDVVVAAGWRPALSDDVVAERVATVRAAVRVAAGLDLGEPGTVDLAPVVSGLVDDGLLPDDDEAAALRSLVDAESDWPLLVAARLRGGPAAIERLVAAWIGAGA